ncbi:MAG TPA: hypothetical protein VE011_03430 [Candidatus Dormibacteraeota bacterium]|nr:hypothetical protein [Candidatus Dormibacteraeota bacterium]
MVLTEIPGRMTTWDVVEGRRTVWYSSGFRLEPPLPLGQCSIKPLLYEVKRTAGRVELSDEPQILGSPDAEPVYGLDLVAVAVSGVVQVGEQAFDRGGQAHLCRPAQLVNRRGQPG